MSNKQPNKKFCTNAGMTLAWTLHAQLKIGICCEGGSNAITGTGSNSIRESETSEISEFMRQQGLDALALNRVATFIANHTPVEQTKFDKCRVGTLVTGTYDDAAGIEQTYSFVIGGSDEPLAYGDDVPILFYEANFAAEFLGKEVGDVVHVRKDGVLINFEITAIAKPEPVNGPVQLPLKLVSAA